MDRNTPQTLIATVAKTVGAIVVTGFVVNLCVLLAMQIGRDVSHGASPSDWLLRTSFLMSIAAIIGVFISSKACGTLFEGYSRLSVMLALIVYAAMIPFRLGITRSDDDLLITVAQYAPNLCLVPAALLLFWPKRKMMTADLSGRV